MVVLRLRELSECLLQYATLSEDEKFVQGLSESLTTIRLTPDARLGT